jgi:hypothetical protein
MLNVLPLVITMALVLARQTNELLRKRITTTTLVLFIVWALLALVPPGFGLPWYVVQVAAYISLASLVVNGVPVLWEVGRRLAEPPKEGLRWYSVVVRISSVVGIGVLIYLATGHRL